MGVGADPQTLVDACLQMDKPMVLDADGLTNLTAIDDWPSRRAGPLVLTPHPGEFARLTGQAIGDIQADRPAAVMDAHRAFAGPNSPPLVLVLKGAGTVVCDGRRVYVNATGNPGMATGGTGDVLTGLCAAIAMQCDDLFDAACLAVHLHGRAGDLAAADRSEPGLIATDLLDYLGRAFNEVIA
jgi:NAD(P)H-hydrate epimerase